MQRILYCPVRFMHDSSARSVRSEFPIFSLVSRESGQILAFKFSTYTYLSPLHCAGTFAAIPHGETNLHQFIDLYTYTRRMRGELSRRFGVATLKLAR